MQRDREGFAYPTVDTSMCTECGLCEKACHNLHPYAPKNPVKTYAAINEGKSIREQSSSGGIFHMLAEKTISQGGVVFGVRFDSKWQTEMGYAETMDGVRGFMGSKYVQAEVRNAFSEALKFLRGGRKVLFSGTPCQIAALNHFLGKDYDNLTTVDVVCHGVPSPKVWGLYLNELTAAAQKAKDAEFRNSRKGWGKYNFGICYDKRQGITLHSDFRNNHFMRAFLHDLILRPSCYNCQAKDGRSHSDITIADFWGIQHIKPEMDDDKGTSLVIVNTDKGYNTLDWGNIKHCEATYEDAKVFNGGLSTNVHMNPKREAFFEELSEANSVLDLIDEYTKPALKIRLKTKVKCIIRKIQSLLTSRKANGGISPAKVPRNAAIPPSAVITPSPTFLTFRDKTCGWKAYRIVIKMSVHDEDTTN